MAFYVVSYKQIHCRIAHKCLSSICRKIKINLAGRQIMSFQMQIQIQQFCSMTSGTLQSIRLKAVVKQSCSKPCNPIRAQINVRMLHVIIWSSCWRHLRFGYWFVNSRNFWFAWLKTFRASNSTFPCNINICTTCLEHSTSWHYCQLTLLQAI